MAEGAVLVAGTINTDLVARVRQAPAAGETVTGESFAIFGGGKAANQAVACARSGASTAMLGAVGRDDFGRQRLADLTKEGIDVADVATVDGVASGVALIFVEANGQNRIAYVPGATLTVTSDQAARAVARLAPRTVLMTLELPLATLETLLDAARRDGATAIVNATPEPQVGRSLVARADILVVNETEATALLGLNAATDWHEVAEALRALGPEWVVVTLGAAGAVVSSRDGVIDLPAPGVEVVDSTGAGDAFCGAMAARMASGADPVSAARFGVLAGSLAVTRAGAQPSMPTAAEIDDLARRFAPA